MPSAIFKPLAEIDVEEAFDWYERRRNGLGSDFLLSIEESIERCLRQPNMYPAVHRDIRRALIRRFPYGIFYIVAGEDLIVIAVLHVRRDPDQLQDRA